MKKLIILFLLFFLFSFSTVYAQTENDSSTTAIGAGSNGGSLFEEFITIFFGNSGNSSENSNTNNESNAPSSGQNPTPGTFPVTDPLPLLNNTGLTYSAALIGSVQKCLSNRSIYEQAASQTGVAWQVLAGIHHKEGGCGTNQSLVSGRLIGTAEPDIGVNCSSLIGGTGKPKVVTGGCGFSTLLDSAIYAGNHLKGKIGGKVPATHQELAKALSRYNGGGNSNCRSNTPYKTHCPPAFEGEDDLYVFNKNPDGKHENMYLLYCADRTKCNPPREYSGIGTLTAAGIIDSISKQ